jgi:hypothetical protein
MVHQGSLTFDPFKNNWRHIDGHWQESTKRLFEVGGRQG